MYSTGGAPMDSFIRRTAIIALCSFIVTFVPGYLQAEQWDTDDIYRKEPSRKYQGPVSFFFVHGYITAFGQDFEDQFSTNSLGDANGDGAVDRLTGTPGLVGRPGNITLANSGGDASFSEDVGLIIGAELNSQLRILTEQHWINVNSDGPGESFNTPANPGNDPFNGFATTQARLTWQPWSDKPYKLTAGRFWTSFGNAQDELLSAQNRFASVPNARYAIPYAFNDGLRLEGAHKLSDGQVGVNWTLEYINGNDEFDQPAGGTFDTNNGQDVVARVGILPLSFISGNGAQELRVGLSYADGTLREQQGRFTGVETNPQTVNADWEGFAVDLSYIRDRFEFRGYYIDSDEELQGTNDLEREGIMGEGSYTVAEDFGVLGSVNVKARYDSLERDAVSVVSGNTLDMARAFEDETLTYGLEFHPQEQLRIGFDYQDSDEGGGFSEVDDDGFVFTTTASF